MARLLLRPLPRPLAQIPGLPYRLAPLQIRMQATRHGMQQWMSAIKS